MPEPSVTTEQQHGHLKELEGIKVRTMHRMVHECVVDGVLKQIVYLTNAQASILTSLRPPDEDLSKPDSPHQHKNPLQRLIEIFVLEERIERGLPPPRMVIRLIRSLEGTGHKFFYAQLHHCSPQYSKKGQMGDGVFMYKVSNSIDEQQQQAELQVLVDFMRDVVIPLAVETNAILIMEMTIVCELSYAFSIALAQVRHSLGTHLPFCVLAVDCICHFYNHEEVLNPSEVPLQPDSGGATQERAKPHGRTVCADGRQMRGRCGIQHWVATEALLKECKTWREREQMFKSWVASTQHEKLDVRGIQTITQCVDHIILIEGADLDDGGNFSRWNHRHPKLKLANCISNQLFSQMPNMQICGLNGDFTFWDSMVSFLEQGNIIIALDVRRREREAVSKGDPASSTTRRASVSAASHTDIEDQNSAHNDSTAPTARNIFQRVSKNVAGIPEAAAAGLASAAAVVGLTQDNDARERFRATAMATVDIVRSRKQAQMNVDDFYQYLNTYLSKNRWDNFDIGTVAHFYTLLWGQSPDFFAQSKHPNSDSTYHVSKSHGSYYDVSPFKSLYDASLEARDADKSFDEVDRGRIRPLTFDRKYALEVYLEALSFYNQVGNFVIQCEVNDKVDKRSELPQSIDGLKQKFKSNEPLKQLSEGQNESAVSMNYYSSEVMRSSISSIHNGNMKVILTSPHFQPILLYGKDMKQVKTGIKRLLARDGMYTRIPLNNNSSGTALLRVAWDIVDVCVHLSARYKMISIVLLVTYLCIGLAISCVTLLQSFFSNEPVLSSYRLVDLIVFGLTLLLSLCASVTKFYNPNIRWRRLRSAACRMESVIWCYRMRIPPFQYMGLRSRHSERALFEKVQSVQDELLQNGDIALTSFQKKYAPSVYRHGQYVKGDDVTKAERIQRSKHNKAAVVDCFGIAEPPLDDHHSPIESLDLYVAHRLKFMHNFFQKRLPSCERSHFLSQFFMFCGSISALALSFLAMNTYVAIVTSCMAAAAAYNESRGTSSKVVRYNNTILSLEKAHTSWDNLSALEKSQVPHIVQLVQEVERIIEAELSSWVSLPSATRSSIESSEQTARGNEHAADAAMRGVTLGQGSNSNRQPS